MLSRFVFALFALTFLLPVQAAAQTSPPLSLVISEVQVSGLETDESENGRHEFIELYNQSDASIDVTGWVVEYFSAARTDVFDSNAAATRNLYALDGVLAPYGYVLVSYIDYLPLADGYFGEGSTATSGLLARSGGHVRLVDNEGVITDVLGWGSAKTPEDTAVPEPQPGYSMTRKIDPNNANLQVDTDNNYEDFERSELPTPTGGSLTEITLPETELDEVEPPVCNDLVITEILPNPDGVDTGKEFIEIHNPTEATVYLEGCSLENIYTSKHFFFPIGATIPAKAYLALYDEMTGLVLANAAGGTIGLIGTDTEDIVVYPGAILSDYSWALVDGSWTLTDRPTPAALNLGSTPVEEEVNEPEPNLEPCPEGKFRNPETNRCKNIQISTLGLASCAPGQVRNLETNRCRSITSLVSSLVPCRAGQERNPETNRCRNILSATASQTPCQEGYERNPETNRCRKIATVLAASPSVGSTDDQAPQKLNYLFLSVASVAVLGYGAYEYKRDIANTYARLKMRWLAKRAVK